jgi:hypothetical protein
MDPHGKSYDSPFVAVEDLGGYREKGEEERKMSPTLLEKEVEGKEGKRSKKGRVRREQEKMRDNRFEVFGLMPLNSIIMVSHNLQNKCIITIC